MRTITILIICQDEERYIGDRLQWVFENMAPNEYVIVDGGSKDNTVDIIEDFKDDYGVNLKLILNSMPDTFAEQRNLAIDHCSMDWIIQMDVDETYSKSIKGLLDDIKNDKYPGEFGFILPTAHLIKDELHMVNGGGDTHLRIFRNMPEVHYEGEVHEELYCAEYPVRQHPNKFKIKVLNTVALKHHSLLKSDDELLAKGIRYQRWAEKSKAMGIDITDINWFVDSKYNYLASKKMYDVPEKWK